jgi:hypothetical protein
MREAKEEEAMMVVSDRRMGVCEDEQTTMRY